MRIQHLSGFPSPSALEHALERCCLFACPVRGAPLEPGLSGCRQVSDIFLCSHRGHAIAALMVWSCEVFDGGMAALQCWQRRWGN